MKLENYEVHLPSYSIGDKIYEKIGPVCESYGKKVLVIGGRKALAAAYDKIAGRWLLFSTFSSVAHRPFLQSLHGILQHGPGDLVGIVGHIGHGLWRGRRQGLGYGEMPVHPR